MPCPLLTISQSDSLIQVVDTNSHTEWQTVQIQKPTDLDVHCLQKWGISRTSRTTVKRRRQRQTEYLIVILTFWTISALWTYKRWVIVRAWQTVEPRGTGTCNISLAFLITVIAWNKTWRIKSTIHPYIPEFQKQTLPLMNLDTSIVANRVSVKNQ